MCTEENQQSEREREKEDDINRNRETLHRTCRKVNGETLTEIINPLYRVNERERFNQDSRLQPLMKMTQVFCMNKRESGSLARRTFELPAHL